jgi:hypothetical protein
MKIKIKLCLIILLSLTMGCSLSENIPEILPEKLENGSGAIHNDLGIVHYSNGRNYHEGIKNIAITFRAPDENWQGEWSIEKHVENASQSLRESTWMKVPFTDESATGRASVILCGSKQGVNASGYPYYEFDISLDLGLLYYRLDAGLYRAVLKGSGGDTNVGGFSVGCIDELNSGDLHLGVTGDTIRNDRVKLKTLCDTYPENAETILYSSESIDGEQYWTGCGAALEKQIDGEWYHMYCSGMYEAVASSLPDQQVMYTSSYYFPLTEGHYRVVKGFRSKSNSKDTFNAICEFDVKGKLKEPSIADFVSVKYMGIGSHGAEFKNKNNSNRTIYCIDYENIIIQSKEQGKWVTLKPDAGELIRRTHSHPEKLTSGSEKAFTFRQMAETEKHEDGSKSNRLIFSDVRALLPIWLEDGTEYFVVCSPG